MLPLETKTKALWELWVDPERRIVSFQPEAVPVSIGTERGPGFRQDLFLYEQDCKPGSVFDSHLSRRIVADTLQPPRERPGQPWGSDPLLPYRCCSG